MKSVFKNKKISGILGILPETLCYYEDEMEDGDSIRNQKIKKNMGYGRRYRAKYNTTVSQLCCTGLHYLLENGILCREDIGAVLVVTSCPDYYVPQVSNLIQADCDLPNDIFAMDIWAGCSGYLDGLLQAFMLLDHIMNKKVLLFNGDIFNRIEDGEGKYREPPYGGDGASITILENTEERCRIPFILKNDGKQKDLIAIYQGAFADIFHRNKAVSKGINLKSSESFQYFQKCVPEVMNTFFHEFQIKKEEIDHFFFIQANRLSVKKFADKLHLPYEQVSMDLVEKYGDLSASLNPVGIVDWYGDELTKDDTYKVVIGAYGAGVRWGAALLELKQLKVCKNIVVNL